jgi:hypothetical protein
MRIAQLLCVIGACVPLALEASAAESPEHGGSSVAVTNMGQAARGAALGRDTLINARRAETQESTQVDSGKGGGSKSRNAAVAVSPRRGSVAQERGVGQLAHSNADRVHSLLSKQAHRRIAQAASRPVGSNRAAATGNVVGRGTGLRSAIPVGLTTLPVSNSAARIRPSLKAVTGGSMIGGPHAVGPGGLGGPAFRRTAQRATIDGTQLHRKF